MNIIVSLRLWARDGHIFSQQTVNNSGSAFPDAFPSAFYRRIAIRPKASSWSSPRGKKKCPRREAKREETMNSMKSCHNPHSREEQGTEVHGSLTRSSRRSTRRGENTASVLRAPGKFEYPLPVCWVYMCVRKYKYACIHACACIWIYACTSIWTWACQGTYARADVDAHVHACAFAYEHAYMPANKDAHVLCLHTYTLTRMGMYIAAGLCQLKYIHT
jgi:hypothetical protein